MLVYFYFDKPLKYKTSYFLINTYSANAYFLCTSFEQLLDGRITVSSNKKIEFWSQVSI